MNTRKSHLSLALTALTLAGPAVAGAEEWQWRITPYVWATDVGVELDIADHSVIDEQIAFSDLLEDLDTAFQMRMEVQRGAHGATADLFDVRLSDSNDDVGLSSEIAMTIFEVAGLYDPEGDQQGLTFLYGARLFNQRAELDLTLAADPASSTRSYDSNDTLVDGMVGVRYSHALSPHWSWQLRADVSAGGTDLTWSVNPQVSFAFGTDNRYALSAGYRKMDVRFETAEPLDLTMTLEGFLLGFQWAF